MYTVDEYKNLTSKYGSYASWAIWNYEDKSDSSIIDRNIDHLNSKFVLLGLNISRPLTDKPWSNFHQGPNNIRKLKYVCYDNKLRGSYMTDIFKGIVELKSVKFKDILTDNIISKNVDLFNQEMIDIGLNGDTQFIVFGTPTSLLARCFNDYFKQDYENQIIYHYHYSYYGLTDREWVNSFWKQLNIHQDFDLTYRNINEIVRKKKSSSKA